MKIELSETELSTISAALHAYDSGFPKPPRVVELKQKVEKILLAVKVAEGQKHIVGGA